MPLAMETIVGQATNIGAGPTNLPAAVGSSLVVRNARLDSRILLLNLWGKLQVTGFVQLRSPRLHDNVRGIRVGVSSAASVLKTPRLFPQRLVPQDALIMEGSSVDAAGNIEYALATLWYEDLAGAAAYLIKKDELMSRGQNLVTVYLTVAAGVGGGFTGAVAINAGGSDLLKANTDYAWLGSTMDVEAAGVFLRGPDTASLRIGHPATTPAQNEELTRAYFVDLAFWFDLPMIPVINSANKGGTLVDVAQDQGGAAVTVALQLVELAPKH